MLPEPVRQCGGGPGIAAYLGSQCVTEHVNVNRRCFVGTAAMAVAAAQPESPGARVPTTPPPLQKGMLP